MELTFIGGADGVTRRQQLLDSWFTFFSLVVFPLLQGRDGLWFAGGWTGFPGREGAMARGIRAACAVRATPACRCACITAMTNVLSSGGEPEGPVAA